MTFYALVLYFSSLMVTLLECFWRFAGKALADKCLGSDLFQNIWKCLEIYYFGLLKWQSTYLDLPLSYLSLLLEYRNQHLKKSCFFISYLPVGLFAWNSWTWRSLSMSNWSTTSETYYFCIRFGDSLALLISQRNHIKNYFVLKKHFRISSLQLLVFFEGKMMQSIRIF